MVDGPVYVPGWRCFMGWWQSILEFFRTKEPKSTALTKLEPAPLAGRPYRESQQEPPKLVVVDLMYNIQGGEGVDPSKIEEFKQKSRRRAIRYFSGKEIRHRIMDRTTDSISFIFNRVGEPQHVAGGTVRIRWTNKAAHTQ
jgi:hypothetical protein